jgi:SPP1 gp7 family putative phage head morphogenesis protein
LKSYFERPSISIQKRYYQTINIWTNRLRKILAIGRSIDEILELTANFAESKQWKQIAENEAYRMVETVSVQNAKSWREVAKKSGKSRQIYEAIRSDVVNNRMLPDMVRANARLISGVPDEIASKISNFAAKSALEGKRSEAVLAEIKRYAPHISESKARLIARTETAKAQSQISQVRAMAVGSVYYRWETSHDQRVRSSHAHMQGVICDFRHPPAPERIIGEKSLGNYNAGCIFNCRCIAQPIIDYEDALTLGSPWKVVKGDTIVQVSREQLERLFTS